MTTTAIGESIKVVAVFDGGLRPVKFDWKGRLCLVKEITYTWHTTEGRDRLVHFAVSDGSAMYELSYNQSTMSWRLEGVDA